MNIIDGFLIMLLLVSVIIGSKKGLIRELMAFIVFFVAIIISVNYIDNFAVWMHNQLGGSSLISALLSFIILLAGTYAVFKLTGILFYKIANLKSNSKRDQMGGALVGFLRGWVAVGFLVFLTFLIPMPDQYYEKFDESFFGPAIAKTIPLIFEGTNTLHPNNKVFIEQIEKTLLGDSSKGLDISKNLSKEDRQKAYRVLFRMEKYFKTGISES